MSNRLDLPSFDPTNCFETFCLNKKSLFLEEIPSSKEIKSSKHSLKHILQAHPKEKLFVNTNFKKKASNKNFFSNNQIKKNIDGIQEETNDQSLRKLGPVLQNNIKIFLNKIRKWGYLKNISVLKPNDFKIINDMAYFQEEKNNITIFNIGLKFNKAILFCNNFKFIMKIWHLENIVLIHPYNQFKLLWDLIISLMIIFLLFYIPFALSFSIDIIITKAKILFLMFLIIDMILEVNTLYFQNGLEVRERSKIIQNYVKSDFLPDLLSLIVFFLKINNFYDFEITKSIELVYFLKINNLKKVSKKIMNRFHLTNRWKGIKNLLSLFFVIIFITHLAACGWYYIGISTSKVNSWIINEGLQNEPSYIQYMSSFYWAIVTVMTVGYGDIIPQNNSERFFCMLIILFGGMIFPYSINSIGLIIQDIQKEKRKFNNILNIINSYMRRKNINPDLQTRVREYLNFLWKEEKSQNMEEEIKIINTLSNSLKEELNLESFGFFVKNNPLFTKFFSESTLKKLVNAMIEISATPDDIIFLQNQKDESAIYFIEKGNVKIYSENSNKTFILLNELKEGEYFGERSFFTSLNRENTAISDNFTTLFMIKQDDFLSILKENKNDFENFMMIKEELLLSNDYSRINKKCFSCQKFSHIIEECPKLHFIPNIEKIIKSYNYPFLNERANYIRKKNKKSRCVFYSTKDSIKSLHKFKKKMKSMKQEDIYNSDSSDLSNSFEEEEEQKNDSFVLNIKEPISKKNTSNLSLQDEDQEININKINDSDIVENIEMEINDHINPSFMKINQNNFEQQHSLTKKDKSPLKSLKNNEEVLQNKKNSLKKTDLFRLKSGIKDEKLQENDTNTNYTLKSLISFNEKIDIDKVYNFKNYFPDFNIESFIKKQLKLLNKEKEITRKYLKKKYRNFKNYTFFENRFFCKLLKEYRNKKKSIKNANSPIFTEINERGQTRRSNIQKKKTENTPILSKKKKTYFEKNEEIKEKISDFSELINIAVEKNNKNKEEAKSN